MSAILRLDFKQKEKVKTKVDRYGDRTGVLHSII